jgi:hypothetical protein
MEGLLPGRGTRFVLSDLEFLMTLQVECSSFEVKIYFCLFDQEFELTLKQLSNALGFSES